MSLYEIIIAGKKMTLEIQPPSQALVDGTLNQFSISDQQNGIFLLTVNGRSYDVYCKRTSETGYDVYFDNNIISVEIEDRRSKLIAQVQKSSGTKSGVSVVKAPMPGLVTVIEVSVGDFVQPGTGLIVLEAMKMENEIRSTIKGKVRSIEVKPKSTIEKNQVLIRIEEQE